MSANHPDRVIDPVCGMSVDVERAEAEGLTADFENRRFAFCRSGCKRAFLEDPARIAAASAPRIVTEGKVALAVIDDGMRRWYDACPCCLSEAYPDIKTALDAEHAAVGVAPATESPAR